VTDGKSDNVEFFGVKLTIPLRGGIGCTRGNDGEGIDENEVIMLK